MAARESDLDTELSAIGKLAATLSVFDEVAAELGPPDECFVIDDAAVGDSKRRQYRWSNCWSHLDMYLHEHGDRTLEFVAAPRDQN